MDLGKTIKLNGEGHVLVRRTAEDVLAFEVLL